MFNLRFSVLRRTGNRTERTLFLSVIHSTGIFKITEHNGKRSVINKFIRGFGLSIFSPKTRSVSVQVLHENDCIVIVFYPVLTNRVSDFQCCYWLSFISSVDQFWASKIQFRKSTELQKNNFEYRKSPQMFCSLVSLESSGRILCPAKSVNFSYHIHVQSGDTLAKTKLVTASEGQFTVTFSLHSRRWSQRGACDEGNALYTAKPLMNSDR